jgi:hypothetical protein
MQGSFVLATLRARPPLHLILPGKPIGTYQVGRGRVADDQFLSPANSYLKNA